jgi:hypothetical protein
VRDRERERDRERQREREGQRETVRDTENSTIYLKGALYVQMEHFLKYFIFS